MHKGAHRSGRKHASAEHLGPVLRIAFYREVERGLLPMGSCDGARGRRAVGAIPPRHEPSRGIEHQVELSEMRPPLPGDAPQYCIHQPGVMRCFAVAACKPHREVDRRMIGHVQP